MNVNINPTDPEAVENVDETTPESSPENKDTDTDPSSDGDKNKKPDAQPKQVPFNEDPKVQEYIERQVDQRGEKLRATITAEVEARLKGFQPPAPKDERVIIPEWFGGDEKQWRAFQADQARTLADERKKAVDEAFERINTNQSTQERAVAEANKWFEDSVAQIEKTTGGAKVDRNELLQYVLENQIIDPKTQRWDYAKGYRFMTAEKVAAGAKGGTRQTRKDLAGATTADPNKGEKENSTVTTNEDFRNPSKRPW